MPTNLKIAKQTQQQQAYTNCVYLHPNDMQRLKVKEDDLVVINESLVHKVKKDDKLEEGSMGTQSLQNNALHFEKDKANGKFVKVDPWSEFQGHDETVAHSINIVVDTYTKAETKIASDALEQYIKNNFNNEIYCKDQRWIIRWTTQSGQSHWLQLHVANVYVRDNTDGSKKEKTQFRNLRSVQFGKIDGNTTVITLMAAANIFMKLTGNTNLKIDFDPEALGIGGLDSQFGIIFRRAFTSRLYPPEVIKSLGVKHVKGMLLYGPPGTGKTLIARSIGKMLTDKEPQVVNGPEIFSKFVGEAEANIRKLFADAIEEQKEKGDESSLHIIIFDEIDAICRQRGTVTSGTGVHDTVVNQLLSMIDGVNALNNILVIGMTNRKDMLDEALLRSGRLEVHIEISLPDESGRQQIFRIHTRALSDHNFLDEKVSLAELAKRTKNYSGAEIEAVVRSAVSFAMQTLIDTQNLKKIDPKQLKGIKITQEYFDMALEEVKPDFGVKEDEIQTTFARGIYNFSPEVAQIIKFTKKLVHTMTQSNALNRQAMLLQGEMSSGKSALASYLAIETKFPFIRTISADKYVGLSDTGVCMSLAKIFDDAYKSNLSCIIIDDIERLIGFTIGPRFSHPVLQALLICVRRIPIDPTRKILIIATSTPDVVRTLELDKVFDYVNNIPCVATRDEFQKVLVEGKYHESCKPDLQSIVQCFPNNNRTKVGIANLLTIIELAINESGAITPESFTEAWQSKYKNTSNEQSDNYLDRLTNLNVLQNNDNDNDNDDAKEN